MPLLHNIFNMFKKVKAALYKGSDGQLKEWIMISMAFTLFGNFSITQVYIQTL